MMTSHSIKGYLARFPLGAAICYVAVVLAFLFAIGACLIAAAASLMRGGHPAHDDDPPLIGPPVPQGVLVAEPGGQPARQMTS